MRYRSSYSSDTSWWEIIICFILVLLIMLGVNTCAAPKWNDGICPDCEARYELRATYKGLKYYACPECGKEVERY